MINIKEKVYQNYTDARLQKVTWGGQFTRLSNKVTFFHHVIRTG